MCQSVSTGPLERRLGLIVPVCLNSKFEPPLPNPNVPDFGSIWYTTGYRSGVETSHSFQAQLEIKSIFTMAKRLAKTWTLWSSMTPILGSAKERNSFGNRRFPLRQKKKSLLAFHRPMATPPSSAVQASEFMREHTHLTTGTRTGSSTFFPEAASFRQSHHRKSTICVFVRKLGAHRAGHAERPAAGMFVREKVGYLSAVEPAKVADWVAAVAAADGGVGNTIHTYPSLHAECLNSLF